MYIYIELLQKLPASAGKNFTRYLYKVSEYQQKLPTPVRVGNLQKEEGVTLEVTLFGIYLGACLPQIYLSSSSEN